MNSSAGSAGGPTSVGVRSQYKAQTRQRLAEAAMVEFEQKGYVNCTIEDIARRAETSRPTFYVHFSSKAELLENMWDVVRRSLLVIYRDLVKMESRSFDDVAAWLQRTYDFYLDNRQRLLAIHEALAIEADLAKAYAERISELSLLVAPLVRSDLGETPESATARAALLTIQHERLCFLWKLRGVPMDEAATAHAMAELWFEQIGTVPRTSAVNFSNSLDEKGDVNHNQADTT